MWKKLAIGVPAAIALVGAVVLFGAGGSSASSDYDLGKAAAAKAYFLHGVLHDPPDIAAEVDNLNNALDTCYLANGASHTALDGGGFTYSDPTGSAQSACSTQLNASNAYAESDKQKGYSAGVEPLTQAYWDCMSQSGVLPSADATSYDTTTPTFVAAADACSASANATFGSSPP